MESRDVKAEMRSTCLKIGLHANFEIIECYLVCGLILPQVRTGDGNPRQNAAGSAGRKLCLEPRGIEVYTAISAAMLGVEKQRFIDLVVHADCVGRSEVRRVGNECVSTCRSRGSP